MIAEIKNLERELESLKLKIAKENERIFISHGRLDHNHQYRSRNLNHHLFYAFTELKQFLSWKFNNIDLIFNLYCFIDQEIRISPKSLKIKFF